MESSENRASRRPNPRGTPLETVRENYLTTLSDTSATNIRPILKQFESHLARNGVETVESIDDQACRSYAKHLETKAEGGQITASTAHTYFNYISGFLGYCVRDALLDTNPALKDTATEHLPEDRGERDRQFWDPADRYRLLDFVDRRVDSALTLPRVPAAMLERRLRDRAIATVLAKTGVRGAEVFAVSNDDARDGLRWRDVNLADGSLHVLGKSRNREHAPLPSRPRNALARWRDALEPPTEDWPVFPSGHAPSKYAAFREALKGEYSDATIGRMLENNDVDDLLREHEVAPPSITTEGARRVMRQLCDAADIELEDGEYLKPHGARRTIGDELYRQDPVDAQAALRHKSIETTKQAYSDIETSELNDAIDALEDG